MSKKQARLQEQEEGPKPLVVGNSALGGDTGKWIRIRKLAYVNAAGKESTWEMAERCTRTGDVDGVVIVATLRRSGKEDCTLLVTQFRPPTEAECVEFPAGLVDENETPEEAALRELKEETGYVGTVKGVSPIVFMDPGMSNANMQFVYVDIDGDAAMNKNPKPVQEENEFITVHVVPKSQLLNTIHRMQNEGYTVISNLYGYALGIHAQL